MHTARVLVCDDHDLIRGLIADVLRDDGLEVSEAASAGEALDALAAAPHDAVLLDLHLRGESGLVLVEQMRTRPALASIPVALLSGDFGGESAGEAERYGVAAVLPKPFEPDALIAAVRRLLEALPRSADPGPG